MCAGRPFVVSAARWLANIRRRRCSSCPFSPTRRPYPSHGRNWLRTRGNGLTQVSYAQVEHLRSVASERVVAVRGNAGAVFIASVRDIVQLLLDLP